MAKSDLALLFSMLSVKIPGPGPISIISSSSMLALLTIEEIIFLS